MKLARPKRGEPFTKPFCVELRFVWTSLAWRNVATLIGKALRAAEAFKCSWKGMWRSSTHPDRLRMFSPGLWRQKNPSLHWALPMELLNILDTAAYSVRLSSFVSMSSPQDHCQFLSAIFRHLVQNQLFHTGAFWWSPVCVGTCKATFSMWPWLLNTDSRIPPFKQHDIFSFTSFYQLRVLTQIFWAHFRLMQISEQGLRKTQESKNTISLRGFFLINLWLIS